MKIKFINKIKTARDLKKNPVELRRVGIFHTPTPYDRKTGKKLVTVLLEKEAASKTNTTKKSK